MVYHYAQTRVQVQGEFWTSSFKVVECFGLRLGALTRAAGFPSRFGGCHQYWLGGAGTADGRQHWLQADSGTGRGLATSRSRLGRAALLSMNPVIPLYILYKAANLRSSCCLRAFKTSKKFSQLSRRKFKKPCIRPLFTFMAAWIIQCWR